MACRNGRKSSRGETISGISSKEESKKRKREWGAETSMREIREFNLLSGGAYVRPKEGGNI